MIAWRTSSACTPAAGDSNGCQEWAVRVNGCHVSQVATVTSLRLFQAEAASEHLHGLRMAVVARGRLETQTPHICC